MTPSVNILRTPVEARAWFDAAGVSIADWSKDHGFSPTVVYSLLAGRVRGKRGDAHRAAVALGLKIPPVEAVLGPRVQSHDMRTQQGPMT
jgi:gp16 family phage-associated protein